MPPNRSTIPLSIPDADAAARNRFGDWIRRYGPAELAGLVTAVLGSYLAWRLSGSEIVAAYGGALSECVGFYGVIVGREMWVDRRISHASGTSYGPRAWLRTGLNLGLEFGGAEIIDSLLIRPLAMGIGAQYLGRQWGVVAGKLVSDVAFYVPVVISYELRRSFERPSNRP